MGEGWGEGEKAGICKLAPTFRRGLDSGFRRNDGVMQGFPCAGTTVMRGGLTIVQRSSQDYVALSRSHRSSQSYALRPLHW